MKALSNFGCHGISNGKEGFGVGCSPSSSTFPWKPAVSLGVLAKHAAAPPTKHRRGEVRQLSASSRDFQEEEEMIRDTGNVSFFLLGTSPLFELRRTKLVFRLYIGVRVSRV